MAVDTGRAVKTPGFATEGTGPRPQAALSSILWIGVLAGTLDISENLIFNQLRGITPTMVFQYIASGLIGTRSFRAGGDSVLLGIALHYTIAVIWTAVFYAASRKFAILTRRPVICGVLYGGIVYLFMNLVVLPLSLVPHSAAAGTLASRVSGVLAVLVCIGLTISLLVERSSRVCRRDHKPDFAQLPGPEGPPQAQGT